jgi:hypothetical protein
MARTMFKLYGLLQYLSRYWMDKAYASHMPCPSSNVTVWHRGRDQQRQGWQWHWDARGAGRQKQAPLGGARGAAKARIARLTSTPVIIHVQQDSNPGQHDYSLPILPL